MAARRRSPRRTHRPRPKRRPGCAICSTAARCANLRAEWPVQLVGAALSGARHRRPLQPALHAAARRRRAERRRAPAAAPGRSTATTATSTPRSARRSTRLRPGDLLLVVSGFGMEPPRAVKRTVARVLGDPMSGTHERAPDGFLLAYGTRGRARPPPARLDRRRRADGAVLPRPAGRPRHGRLRATGPVHARVHDRAADCVHADTQSVMR